jgi:signal transduction histidine kinase/CheY-like chemotaxis protein
MPLDARIKTRKLFPALVATVALVLAAVSAFVCWTLYQSHERYFAEAANNARNVATSLEHALDSHFEEVDLALQRARREFQDLHAQGRFTPQRFSDYLISLKERLPQALSIRGADANGMVVYGEDIDPAKINDLKIREFYQRVLTERDLVFGVPVRSRISHQMVFPLIYAMTLPDGSFGGAAYVSMSTARITEMMSALNLDKHGIVSLVDTRRRLLHRYPELPGEPDPAPRTMSAVATAAMESGAPRAAFNVVSQLDGERRHYSLERIGHYPIYVVVGLSERDFLAPWYREAYTGAIFLAVLYLLAGLLLVGARAALQQQKGAVDALVAKEKVLQEALADQREAHAALIVAKDQALAAGRAKSDFVANMSHEIRSPMNAVFGMLQLLQRTAMSALQRDYVAKAEISARALLGILNDILDFSKVEEGKLELDPQSFSIDRMLRELAVILSANASGKGIEVLFDISPALPHALVGDALRLQQVLLNLAGNAIKFTEQGEVVLCVRPVASRAGTLEVEFAVRDTGIGIAPEHLDHIFDGFAQAEASTARRFGGTGLGLTISARLVQLMGGTLAVRSVPGKGSVFSFAIALGLTSEALAPRQEMQKLRCLVVDDNTTGREVLGAIVRSFGWHADLVPGAIEALGALAHARSPYDVVFIDWRMPGMDGWEASERIRAMAGGGRAPLIVMVTAHDRELVTQKQAGLNPLLDAMLAKPVTASVVFDKVAELRLGQRETQATVAPARGTRLHGMRLLLVEDNAMNQLVARELLRGEGAQVAVAAGGGEAIDAVGREVFDLILMDIQMPDMDGYAATAIIRERLGAAAPPIVAMTANAMESDRRAASAAGMADHVGKPFDLDRLVDVILGHAAPAAAAAVLDAKGALARLGGDARVYATALQGFDAEMAALGAQLGAAREIGDKVAAARALHNTRSLSGMIGASALFDAAQAAETRCRSGSADCWDAVEQVLAEAARARTAARGGLISA